MTMNNNSFASPLPQIVTRLSAVMDYSRVPGGALALRHLQEKHPDIHLSYDDTLELHTVYGAYSKVQAALTQLFGQPGNQQPDTVQQAPSGSWSEHSSQKQQTTPSEGGKPSKQGGQSKTVDTLRIPECSSSSQRDQLTSLAYGGEDIGQREGATPQLNWPSEDESLLIVDADMFQYLQKYCQKDYQQILSVYGVEVVEMTNQGFTSLYLQPAAGAEESVRDRGSLSLARNAMSQFFLENEAKIWRADFSKSIFASGKDLQMAKDNLSLRHPTILLKEDDTNIYMIGNYKDMWDAKQFFLDQSLHQYLKSEEDEMARRCRLAPRFKESGLPPLGSRPTDFCLRGATTAQSRPKSSGPMLGFNVLSEPGQTGERVPRVPPQIAAEDFLFKSQRSLSPTLSMQNDTSLNSDLIKSQPKTASLDRSLGPPAVSGSTLKRANSFSGTPQRKPQVTQQGSQDDTTKSTAGARSSSSGLTDHLSRDRQAGYTADIVLSSVMWQHIKEAHGTQVGDLTSDIQTRESVHADGGSVTVYLRGASSSKLKSCRLGLQKLIDSVSADFFVHKLPLSELGLTDPTDETLLACCNNMRSCFHTVTIQITEENVSLLGPKLRCSQAAASLLGVFSRDLAHSYTHQEFPDPSTSKYDPETLTQSSKDQSSTLRSHSKSQPMPETSTGSTDGTSIDRERRTNHAGFAETENVNGSVSQPRPYKDPVIKEKVKYAGTWDRNGQKTSVFASIIGDDGSENDAKSATSLSAKESGDSAQKERAQQRHKERESRSSAEAERLGWGIHGRMTFSKLSISIPGHQNDAAIKITYYIPDGIQKVSNLS